MCKNLVQLVEKMLINEQFYTYIKKVKSKTLAGGLDFLKLRLPLKFINHR